MQRSGYDVTTAATGLEGLAALEARAYAVILCDMRMPDLDGPGFYRELERRHPHLVSRVIFLTGDVLSPDAAGLFRAGRPAACGQAVQRPGDPPGDPAGARGAVSGRVPSGPCPRARRGGDAGSRLASQRDLMSVPAPRMAAPRFACDALGSGW